MIFYAVRPLFELDNEIIDIALDFLMGHIIKNCFCCPLVSYSCIIKCKGHNLISKNAFRCAASHGLLIFWRHLNLIVSCSTVHEFIFRTRVVEIPEVHINVKLLVCLPDRHDVCDPYWILDLANESCLYQFGDLFFNFWYQLWEEFKVLFSLFRCQ